MSPHLDGRKRTFMQQTDQIKREEKEVTRKLFVEPEVSCPVDVLEATAFFQGITGGTDVTPNFTP
jgi:hypothetical protein